MGIKHHSEKTKAKTLTCFTCLKLFSKLGLKSHIWRAHTQHGRKFKPGAGKVSWNRGKTTPQSVKDKMSVSVSKAQRGRKLSKSHKKSISRARLQYLKNNPDKVPYVLNHYTSESYPEKLFREALIAAGIKGWVQYYRHSIYEYDFAFVDKKIDVEIDGATHKQKKVRLKDKRRDEFSRSRGWTVIRIPAIQVIKHPHESVAQLVAAAPF